MKKDVNNPEDPETESFNRAMKIAVIVFAIIESLIMLPLIYFKLAK